MCMLQPVSAVGPFHCWGCMAAFAFSGSMPPSDLPCYSLLCADLPALFKHDTAGHFGKEKEKVRKDSDRKERKWKDRGGRTGT